MSERQARRVAAGHSVAIRGEDRKCAEGNAHVDSQGLKVRNDREHQSIGGLVAGARRF
jgi:hypothetical protein